MAENELANLEARFRARDEQELDKKAKMEEDMDILGFHSHSRPDQGGGGGGGGGRPGGAYRLPPAFQPPLPPGPPPSRQNGAYDRADDGYDGGGSSSSSHGGPSSAIGLGLSESAELRLRHGSGSGSGSGSRSGSGSGSGGDSSGSDEERRGVATTSSLALTERRGAEGDDPDDRSMLALTRANPDMLSLHALQSERVANLLDKPTDALLLVLGQKYLAQLKKQARMLHTMTNGGHDRSAASLMASDALLASPLLGTRALSAADSAWPSGEESGTRKRGRDADSGGTAGSDGGVSNLDVHPDAAGESLTPGKRVRVVAANDEDTTAGKLLLSFFNTVNQRKGLKAAESLSELRNDKPKPSASASAGSGAGSGFGGAKSDPRLAGDIETAEAAREASTISVQGTIAPNVMAALEQANSTAGDGRRVLVADDSQSTRRFLKVHLEKNGYTVETAENGQHALDCMKRKSYDIVFLDLEMPIMNGFSCSAAFREWERTTDRAKRQPICALSMHAGKKEKDMCAEVGVDFFEAKPAKIPGLMKIAELCIKLQSPQIAGRGLD